MKWSEHEPVDTAEKPELLLRNLAVRRPEVPRVAHRRKLHAPPVVPQLRARPLHAVLVPVALDARDVQLRVRVPHEEALGLFVGVGLRASVSLCAF